MEKRKGEDGLKIWKRKVIGHGVLGILLSFVIVGNATGIYGILGLQAEQYMKLVMVVKRGGLLN